VEVDPVSGNDVPPGSLPEEVRDDIPAQLSEGEYVVPADVLRFYGMKFFEDLRKEAKIELARMDAEGRIGGEPMGEMQEGDLTPEEMAEIDSMMMAVGGYATQQPTQSTQPDPYQQQQMMYRQGAPVAMGNAGYAQGGDVRGYAPGGDVVPMPNVPEPTTPLPTGTQAQLDFSQFGAGFSFSPNAQQNLQQLGQPTQAQPTFTPVTLYAPDGTEVTANTQEEYNKYISMGYTTTPPVQQNDNDDGPPPTDTEPKDPTSWADGLDFTDPEALEQSLKDMISLSKGEKAATSGAVALLGGIGAVGAGAYRATGIARANAVVNMIEGVYPDLAARMRGEIKKEVDDSLFLKNLPDDWINGSKITQQLIDRFGTGEGLIINQAMSASKDFYLGLSKSGGPSGTKLTSSEQAAKDEQTVMSQQVGDQGSGSSNDDGGYTGPDGKEYKSFADYVAADTAEKAKEAAGTSDFEKIMGLSAEETGLAGKDDEED
jgi:hypothetical protein